MYLRQIGLNCNACGSFAKNKERIQKFKETEYSRYIYQNEKYKSCLQHDMTYRGFKDLPRRKASYKILHDKAFNIGKNPKYDGYQRGLASVIYKFLDKKYSALNTSATGAIKFAGSGFKSGIMPNQELAEESHKPIIREFEKRKVYSSFKGNICGTDLADMKIVSKFNKGFWVLLCVSKYACVVPLKDKKGIIITKAFLEILDESERKPNKIWVDKGSKFCNRSVRSWLQDYDIKMKNLPLLKDLLEP